jgi:hypothetical protein
MINATENKMTLQFEEVEANIVLDKGVETGYFVNITGKGSEAKIEIFYTDINDKQVKRGRTFHIGDTAEWGSHNISYMGRILKITQNTVTISHSRFGSGRGTNKVLKLHQFCWRNKQFDVAATEKSNRIEMMNH